MNISQGKFDFSRTIEAIRPWMDSSHPDFCELNKSRADFLPERNRFSKALFLQFPEFLKRYIENDDFNGAENYFLETTKKVKDVLVQQSKFPENKARQKLKDNQQWREPKYFALTQAETRHALDYMHKNEAWAMAGCLFRDALESFIFELKSALKTHTDHFTIFGEQNESHKNLFEIFVFGTSESITHELWPILSSEILETDEISEFDLAKSLCATFRNKAMVSNYNKDMGYDKDEKQFCAFGPVLAELSSVTFKCDEAGMLEISNNRRPGAFFFFLYQKGKDIIDEYAEIENRAQRLSVDHSF